MTPLILPHIVPIYLVVINVVTFFTYGIDKWKARKSKWRISETTLLGMVVCGGSIGAWIGMKVWHHKTLHKKFKYGIPLILIAQIALLLLTSCQTKQNIETALSIQHEYTPVLTRLRCVPIGKKEDGVHHRPWTAMRDDTRLTAIVRSCLPSSSSHFL